jgi:hypothetical protein
MSRIGKIKRQMIAEANRRLLNEQPVGAELNLFCKNIERNTSFRENGLTYYQQYDLPKNIKRLLLTRSEAGAMDNVAGDAGNEGQFMLDIVPVESLGDRFSGEIDSVEGDIALISYSGPMKSVPYFCTMDSGTDKAWEDYFNSL